MTRLGDICEKIGSGATPHGGKEAYCLEGISFVRSQNIGDFSFSANGLAYINNEQAKKLSNVELKPNDVLLNITGDSVARACIMDSEYLPARVNQHVAVIRGKKDIVLSSYLLYFLQWKKKHLLQLASAGATRNALTKSMIEQLEIELPTIEQQRKIVGVLDEIQEKIRLNQKINDNLEQQAETLFKSWFVDFESVSNLGFIESEIGRIPHGWRVYKLSEFVPIITGKKNANVSSDNGAYPFFSCSQDFSWTDEYSFEGHAILVAGNGDFNVKRYNGKFEAYQRTYVLIPYIERYASWLYYAVKHNLTNITSAARGSVIKFITKGNLENFAFAAPKKLDDLEIIDIFNTINHTIDILIQENSRLVSLRNILLPKLMSGEIDVCDIQL